MGDASMGLDWSALISAGLLVALLVAAAALVGWLAARFLLHATRARADAPRGREGR